MPPESSAPAPVPARLLAEALDAWDWDRYRRKLWEAINRAAVGDQRIREMIADFVDAHCALAVRLLDAHPEEVEFRAEFEAFQIRNGALLEEAEAAVRGH